MRIFVSCMLMWHFLHQQVQELHAVAARPHGAVLLLFALPLPPGQAGPRQPAQQRREVAPSVVTTICSIDYSCFQLRQQRELVLQQLQPGHEQQPAPGPRAGASPPADQRGRQPRVGVEQRGHPRALVDTLVLSSVICRLLFLFSTSC